MAIIGTLAFDFERQEHRGLTWTGSHLLVPLYRLYKITSDGEIVGTYYPHVKPVMAVARDGEAVWLMSGGLQYSSGLPQMLNRFVLPQLYPKTCGCSGIFDLRVRRHVSF